jgi:hypothetical protein
MLLHSPSVMQTFCFSFSGVCYFVIAGIWILLSEGSVLLGAASIIFFGLVWIQSIRLLIARRAGDKKNA